MIISPYLSFATDFPSCHSERSERGPRPAPGSPANLFAGVGACWLGQEESPHLSPKAHPKVSQTPDRHSARIFLFVILSAANGVPGQHRGPQRTCSLGWELAGSQGPPKSLPNPRPSFCADFFVCHSERSERGPRPAPGSPANLFAGVGACWLGQEESPHLSLWSLRSLTRKTRFVGSQGPLVHAGVISTSWKP